MEMGTQCVVATNANAVHSASRHTSDQKGIPSKWRRGTEVSNRMNSRSSGVESSDPWKSIMWRILKPPNWWVASKRTCKRATNELLRRVSSETSSPRA